VCVHVCDHAILVYCVCMCVREYVFVITVVNQQVVTSLALNEYTNIHTVRRPGTYTSNQTIHHRLLYKTGEIDFVNILEQIYIDILMTHLNTNCI
jgi:hypothetical protein